MREILFKAKRKDNGKWVEGLIWKKKNNTSKIFISCFPDKDDNEEVYVIDQETICQYTGLTDKNGNKIWENDIVTAHFRSNKSMQKFKVVFDDAMFLFDNLCVSVPKYDVYKIKVIGNIFDNPELLKGGAE